MLNVTVDIVLDRLLIRDVLKAIISSIFFHRLFGSIRPISPPQEVLDLTYPSVDDPELEFFINDKLTKLTAALDTASQAALVTPHLAISHRGGGAQIAIAFYEKKTRKAWFSKSEEEVCWEQWTITVSSITPRNENERALLSRSAEQQLQNILFKIIDFVGENKTHIPSITSSEGNPFPYSIALPSEAEESWGSVFKKILVE
ncbi:autophagy-related protein [Kockiozyma suomiensis]|uniref:autophagy-related protein n=1 Tax=Kockiozyma suomiensis TaxID=1337062 RepID=UPI0033436E1A